MKKDLRGNGLAGLSIIAGGMRMVKIGHAQSFAQIVALEKENALDELVLFSRGQASLQ